MVGFRLAHRLTRYSLIVNGPPSTHKLLLKVGCRSYCTTSWNSIRNLFPLKSISGPLACTPRTSYTHLLQYPFAQVLRHEQFCTTAGNEEKQKISVTFVDKDGEEQRIKVPVGMSMLEAAHENDIELEGACEASLACSTCHVIVMVTVIRICCLFFITKKFSMMHSSKLSRKWDAEYYNKLDDPTDDENDMLDLAFGLCNTSRLGCQVIAKPELDGIQLALPGATRNFAVDGYKPKSH